MYRIVSMFKSRKHIKRNIARALGICMALPVLTACSERDGVSPEEKIPEGMVKVSLLIPDYGGGVSQFGTRAYNTDEEGYMANLYVIAVKYAEYDEKTGDFKTDLDEDKRVVYTYSLNPTGEKFQVEHDTNGDGTYDDKDYHAFNITLYPGKYKFGVLANADLYLKRANQISEFTKESELNEIVLNFNENTPLTPRHLPMACLPDKMQYSDDISGEKKKNSDYTVPIKKNNETHLWADMDFLCAKVRYTIMFDKNPKGISEAFGSSWIRFNVDDAEKPEATNIRRQTKLFPDNNSLSTEQYDESDPFMHSNPEDKTSIGSWEIPIDRYKWPTDGEDYPLTPNSKLEAYDRSTQFWIEEKQKVWQGVVYLPENKGVKVIREVGGNNQEDNGNDSQTKTEEVVINTVLKFPYFTKANSNDDTPYVKGKEPKEIWLFGNPNETYYNGTTDSGSYTKNETAQFEGIERDMMYDVVVKVKNPELEDMTVQIFVSILDWHDEGGELDEGWLYNPGTQKQQEEEESVNTKSRDWEYQGSNTSW